MKDRKQTEDVSSATINILADKLEALLTNANEKINAIDFYGNDFGMDRLGHIIIPYLLRRKIRNIKNNRLKLENGPYPPRKDGGYGWFIVEETTDKNENCAEYNSGCNIALNDTNPSPQIYYYWIGKYFDCNVYHNRGMRWMCQNGIAQNIKNGVISKDKLSQENAAYLIQNNLITQTEDNYHLNVPYFTEEQFSKFISLFELNDEKLDDILADWIVAVRKNFESFVPKHLHNQINQWISCYLYQIVGYVTDELICRGILSKPDSAKPLTNGVFCVEGKNIHP